MAESRGAKETRVRRTLGKYGINGPYTLKFLSDFTGEQRAIRALARALGVTAEFFEADSAKAIRWINGITMTSLPDSAFINRDSTAPLLTVAGHEIPIPLKRCPPTCTLF